MYSQRRRRALQKQSPEEGLSLNQDEVAKVDECIGSVAKDDGFMDDVDEPLSVNPVVVVAS